MPWTKLLVEKQAFSYDVEEMGCSRKISYGEAIREALDQALALDERVYIMGQGVDDPGGMFGATLNLHKKYGLNIDVEVIDLRFLKPLDEELLIHSVNRTGRLVIADTGWRTGGISAEIASLISEKCFTVMKKPIKRVACPNVPTPASYVLEEEFYPGSKDIVQAALELME